MSFGREGHHASPMKDEFGSQRRRASLSMYSSRHPLVRSTVYIDRHRGKNPLILVPLVGLLVLVIIVGFAIADPRILHWFVIPIFFCGIVVGMDAMWLFRDEVDPFDCRGLIGIVGIHFFVIAPLLVGINAESFRIEGVIVDNPKEWLGLMACVNFLGLIAYKFGESLRVGKRLWARKRFWTLNVSRARWVIPIVLALTTAAYLVFLERLGGLSGFIRTRAMGPNANLDTAGLGVLMVIGHSVPIVLLIGITCWKRLRSKTVATRTTVCFVLLVFLVVQLFVSGLSGSRNSTIWGMFWAVGIIHYFWRPISTRHLLIGIIPFLAFMYLYSFYKSLGEGFFDYVRQGETLTQFEAGSHRTFVGMLVGDLSRADVQAAQLYVLLRHPWDYELRLGETYVTSVSSYVPTVLWPNKPKDPGKVLSGTEMLFGPRSYSTEESIWNRHGGWRSTRIYGLAGESMLNFGLLGVLPAFFAWGLIVRATRSIIGAMSRGDLRLFLAPFFVIQSVLLLVNDSDNFVTLALFKLMIPLLLVLAISVKGDKDESRRAAWEED
jgi:hypothetical protein